MEEQVELDMAPATNVVNEITTKLSMMDDSTVEKMETYNGKHGYAKCHFVATNRFMKWSLLE